MSWCAKFEFGVTQGKTYVMQDGDIVHFMFNVTAKKK